MKIIKILNRGFSNFNSHILMKFENDVIETASLSGLDTGYKKSNFFNTERGTLSNSDVMMVAGIKNMISETLKVMSSRKKAVKEKILNYSPLVRSSENNILAFKVNNPKITAISGQVKTIDNEEYFDFTLYGYFGDKKRYFINNEGEILKSTKKGKNNIYDTEPDYYSQHEINNLGINKYFKMFKTEIDNFRTYLNLDIPIKKEPEPVNIDWASYLYHQNEKLDSIRDKFDILHDGISQVSRTAIRKRKLSEMCGVKFHKKFPLIELINFNELNQNAQINFTSIGNKKIVRIVVFGEGKKNNRLFVGGQLVEESARENCTNPFVISRILRKYSLQETEQFGVKKLLDDIDNKLSESIKKFKALIG